jgi:hypothetical protein
MAVSFIQNASLASGVPSASNITSGTLPKAQLPTGSVLQVVSTTKTDTFSTSSTSYTDLTGLSVSITPTSATSKVLVFYTVNGKQTTTPSMRLVRNSTAICIAIRRFKLLVIF